MIEYLERNNFVAKLYCHPAVFTVEEARSLRGTIPGGHTKNLFLKDRKGALFLVSALEEAEIDLKTLHTRIGAKGRLSFGSAELLQEVLGVAPGAVSPLGLLNDATGRCSLVLDRALYDFETINFHPLDNRMTISISPTDFDRFLQGIDRRPIILAFPGP